MFTKSPNLPEGNVTAMLLSPQYDGVVSDLRALGIELILTEQCDDVQAPVSFHADVLSHHLGGEDIMIYPYSYNLEESLNSLGMRVSHAKQRLSPQYPHDIWLNAARIADKLICNKKYTDDKILSSVTYENIIDVSQGYAKCATLIVDEYSIITADKTIANAWEMQTNSRAPAFAQGYHALRLCDGGIRLDGYDYGFIGGTAVKLAKNKIYFTGRLSPHRDASKIREFLAEREIEIIEGSYDSLIDIGSMLPLMEE